jgi:hypothetical protein
VRFNLLLRIGKDSKKDGKIISRGRGQGARGRGQKIITGLIYFQSVDGLIQPAILPSENFHGHVYQP